MAEQDVATEQDELLLLVAIVVCVVGVIVAAYKLIRGRGGKSYQQTVREVEEATPLLDSEAQQYINKLRKEMGSAGIQLGGEFEYKLAQAHLKSKREKEAQNGSTVRQRAARDPRTA